MLLFLGPNFLQNALIRLPVILVALTFHEFAHAWIAYRCGDDTAKRQGRLTLNPLAHLDPLGTICLFFGLIGWAKPVPIDPFNFRHPRKDEIKVSLAGPASNFILAIVSFLILKIVLSFHASDAATFFAMSEATRIIIVMLFLSVIINFALMLFNLLPLFPLDGSHVVQNMLKYPYADRFAEFSRKAPMILIGIIIADFYFIPRILGYSILWKIFRFPSELLMDNLLSSNSLMALKMVVRDVLGYYI